MLSSIQPLKHINSLPRLNPSQRGSLIKFKHILNHKKNAQKNMANHKPIAFELF